MVSLPEIDPASSMIVVETIVLMPLALSPVSVIQSGRAGRRVDFDLAAWPTAVRSVGAARDRPITLDSNHLIGDARTGYRRRVLREVRHVRSGRDQANVCGACAAVNEAQKKKRPATAKDHGAADRAPPIRPII
jgi:hypothetical protein